MNLGVGIAGVGCVALAFGHATVGLAWVLPRLTDQGYPGTQLGPPHGTEAMVRVTWHIVTVFVLALGGLLVTLAWFPGADTTTALLRWFAAMWLTAAAMAFWVTRRHPRLLLRLPVPFTWVVIAILCWQAST
jgi:hypothetical protein